MSRAEANIVAWWQIYGAAIRKQRTNRGSRKIVFIGAMSADVVILAAGVVLSGDRQREEKKKEKNIVYRFL